MSSPGELIIADLSLSLLTIFSLRLLMTNILSKFVVLFGDSEEKIIFFIYMATFWVSTKAVFMSININDRWVSVEAHHAKISQSMCLLVLRFERALWCDSMWHVWEVDDKSNQVWLCKFSVLLILIIIINQKISSSFVGDWDVIEVACIHRIEQDVIPR